MSETDSTVVDARGLSCPQPMLATRKALAGRSTGKIQVLVDTGTQRDNVARCAKLEGWESSVETTDDGFRVLLSKP